MFQRIRGRIREVEVEVIPPADLELVPPIGIQVVPPVDKPPDEPRPPVGIEVVPRVDVEVPPADAPKPPVDVERPSPATERGEARWPEWKVPKPKPSQAQPEAAASPTATPRSSGREQPPVEETVATEPRPLPLTELTCEILFWRGYRKARFYARIFNDEGEPLAITQSPFFRPRGNGMPDQTEEAVAAYEELREQLERDGWKHVDEGESWFRQTFSRPATDAEGPAPA